VSEPNTDYTDTDASSGEASASNEEWDRRTVLTAMAGGAGLAAAGSTPAAATQQAAGAPRRATSATPAGGAAGTIQRSEDDPATLEGDVRVPPVEHEGTLLVGTTQGLYILDGARPDIETFVPTQPITAVEPVGANLVVVLVEDRFFPNVLAVDPVSGEVRWSASRTVSVYNQEFGAVERQAPAFDAVAISGGNAPDVAVAMAHGVVAFDGNSGEQLWVAETDYYTWRLAASDGVVYAGTQGGRLLALNADSGDQAFATDLADPATVDGDTIQRSVWNVIALDDGGPGALAVTTEDGYLKLVDDDGSVAAETRVLDPSDDLLVQYYRSNDGRPTTAGGPGSSPDRNFFNLDAVPTPEGFVVRVTEPTQRGANRRLEFVSRGGDSQWTNNSLDLTRTDNLLYDPAVDSTGVFTAGPPFRAAQPIARVDLADGSEEMLAEVPTVPGADRGSQDVGFVGTYDGGFALARTAGDISLVDASGDLRSTVPAVRDGRVLRDDFRGAGTEDTLIISWNRSRGRISSRSLVLRSGTDGSVVWSRTLDVPTYLERGGLRNIRVLDPPGEGKAVMGFERPRDGDAGPPALVVIAGEDGSELRRIELLVQEEGGPGETRRRPLLPVSVDILGVEGEPDGVALVGGRERLALVGLGNGEVFQQHRYSDDPELPPFDTEPVGYRAVDGPGRVDDVVAVGVEEPALAVLETSIGEDEIEFEARGQPIGLDGDRVIPGAIEVLSDYDGGSYPELVVRVQDDGGLNSQFVSLDTEEVVDSVSVREGFAPTMRETVGVTGEGPGLLAAYNRGEELGLRLFEGRQQRWELATGNRLLGARTSRGLTPAAPAGDIDGDGNEEIAVGWYGNEGGVKIDFHNVSTDERVESLRLERFPDNIDLEEVNLSPALHVERLPYGTSDDPLLGLVVGRSFDAESLRFYVVDPVNSRVLASGDTTDSAFITVGTQQIGLVGRDGSLRMFDPTAGISLDDPDPGTAVDLSWSFDDDRTRVTTVRVNQRPVTITTDQSTTVRLPSGTHDIEVRARAPDGVVSHDGTEVAVDGGSLAATALYAAAGVSTLSLFGFGLLERLRRWRE